MITIDLRMMKIVKNHFDSSTKGQFLASKYHQELIFHRNSVCGSSKTTDFKEHTSSRCIVNYLYIARDPENF